MAVDLEYYGVPAADYREQENRTRLTLTAGQTTASAPYSVGYVDVYYNGAKLDPFTEFTATDGANIVLASGASASGDILEVISRAQVQVANVYTQQQVNALLVPYFAVATGTGDAQVAVTNPTFTSYVDGMNIKIRTAGQNTTTTPTINCNTIGNKTIVSNNAGAALFGKDWVAGSEITLRYNQTLDKLILIEGKTTIQTPAQFDNSNQIPTTAFVQRSLGNFQGIVSVTAATTLTAAQSGSLIECSGSSTYTLTLPAPSTQNLTYTFICNASVSLTLTTPSGLIYNMGAAATSQSLLAATSCTLVSDGASWIVIQGNGAGSVTSAGYQKLPSGVIIQWGGTGASSSSAAITVTFPIAFPTSIFCVNIGGGTIAGSAGIATCDGTATTTGFPYSIWSTSASRIAGIGSSFVAIGH